MSERLSKEELAKLVKESEKSTPKERKDIFSEFFKSNRQILTPCT